MIFQAKSKVEDVSALRHAKHLAVGAVVKFSPGNDAEVSPRMTTLFSTASPRAG